MDLIRKEGHYLVEAKITDPSQGTPFPVIAKWGPFFEVWNRAGLPVDCGRDYFVPMSEVEITEQLKRLKTLEEFATKVSGVILQNFHG